MTTNRLSKILDFQYIYMHLLFSVVYKRLKLFPKDVHIKAWAGLICKFPMTEYLADGDVILLH